VNHGNEWIGRWQFGTVDVKCSVVMFGRVNQQDGVGGFLTSIYSNGAVNSAK
jgi:hypothetical protein